jgi:hypothetical protein
LDRKEELESAMVAVMVRRLREECGAARVDQM